MAAAVIGGAFLSASLQVLFDRMASREFLNFFKGRKRIEGLSKKLKATLVTINIVLDDADNKQFTDSGVKEWLEELQDAVYHADDLVDEIATHEAMQRQLEADSTSSISNHADSNLTSSSTNMYYEEMESKLEDVIERLDIFARNKDVLGLKQVTWQRFSSDRLPSTSLVDETGVYGRHEDQEKIIRLLLSDDATANQISVIPIVGMGGIGKTTLAQLLYNDDRVKGYFDKKAWVCVSEPFDVFGVTRTILEAITSFGCDIKDDLNRLQQELSQRLNQQKFLLVLDDVWTESFDDWDLLRRPFRSGSHGSKVIVTTRNSGVATMMQTVPFHRMQELSYEDSWSLFSKHAFENGDPSQYSNLVVIGEEIVRKCGGLPLAAKTLGGLLRSKVDVEEWEYICKSDIWDLPTNKCKIIPALRLSYQYLPSWVKSCFAYCSTFPKDYVFGKEELVILWMAHSLLPKHPKSKMTLEDLGDLCFRELLSRSFFQHSFGNESRFVMHDLIHDLAQFISGEFFYKLDDEKQPVDIPKRVRHYSYARRFNGHYSSDTFEVFKEINDVKTLRSFLPFNSWHGFPLGFVMGKILHEMLPNLRCLRVLSLSHYIITELPDSISNLMHLRYFDVSYTEIKCLPESITSLYNLQTLLLSNCHKLTKLPQDLRKLSCLRILDLTRTCLKEMPLGMDQLSNLRFLSTFVVGNNSGSRINALRKLDNLRKTLSISGLENVINGNDALAANLKCKKHLEDLVLQWNTRTHNSQHEQDVLDKLQPHTNLKNLTIKNYGGETFPRWLGGNLLPNMISLTLESCVNCLILPQLGQLPSLKFLTIIGMKQITVVGQEFFGDDSIMKPFQSLKTLRFEGMIEWEEWHMLDAGEFACLEELSIANCPKLTGKLPNRVVSLRILKIHGCHQLVASNPNEQVTVFCNQVGLLEQCLSSLQSLVISDIPTLVKLPRELSKLTSLHELTISKCGMLDSFPDTGLPSRLRDLRIEGCEALKSFPSGGLPTALERLKIRGCREIELPNEMEKCYTSIKELTLSESCDSLKSYPLSLCPNALYLLIKGCRNFETFSILNRLDNHNLRLQDVQIKSCPNLISFSVGGLPAPDLKVFSIFDCGNVKSLPSFFTSLKSLIIEGCPELECLTEGCLPSSLQNLSVRKCQMLMARRKDWDLQILPSLSILRISGEYDEEEVWKTFPEEWLLPSSLCELEIWDCPNLKALNYKGLQHLASLKSLRISMCPQFESLSKEVLPSSITELVVEFCSPLLKQRMQKETGEDWPKISHIPLIKLDDDVF